MNERVRRGMRRIVDQGGLSLVELLIAMAISLVLLGGVYRIFVSSTRTYAVQNALSRLQENGRFAIDFLTRDIRDAGYQGCLQDPTTFQNNVDMSSSAYIYNFSVGIDGFDGQGSGWYPSPLDASIVNPVQGTDVVTIRGIVPDSTVYMQTTMPNVSADLKLSQSQDSGITKGEIVLISDCEGATVFQVTGISPTGSGMDNAQHNTGVAGVSPGNKIKDFNHTFQQGAEISKFRTTSFFIRNNTAGQPSLYRTDNPKLPGALSATQELLEGVENMQIRYGVAATSDKASPVTQYLRADQVTDWNLVKSVQIALLLRTLKELPGVTPDTKTYTLLPGLTWTAPGDQRLRRVFVTTIGLRNRLQ